MTTRHRGAVGVCDHVVCPSHLAERPGESLTTQQIVAGLKVERKDISGALSGLSRRAKSRYKLPVWFFWAQWDGVQYTYRMDEREASVVREVLGN